MNETPAQYKQRLFNNVGEHDPIEVMTGTPSELRQLFDKYDVQRWKRPLPGGEWSPAQILAHLAEGELVFSYRLRFIVRASGSPMQAFDQNVWVEDSPYLISQPQLALELFESLRRANLAFIQSLSPDAMQLYGLHAERGKETAADLIRLCGGHDLNHLRQINERLSRDL